MRWLTLLLILLLLTGCQSPDVHQRVAARRGGVAIICHRGAHEFAHENTLEAYRATFELGGDGNEIDIRQTKDGVLVLFHDDMLDVNLKAFGDVSDYTWKQLQKFEFRDPGPFGDACHIPTLKEVFELHKKYAGLMHLDIKVPNIDGKIAKLLDDMDMWEQVSNVSEYNSENIRKNSKLKARPYKAGLYEDHSEVFPDAIAAALKKQGDDIICDDPRGVAIALGRRLRKISTDPVQPKRERRENVDMEAMLAAGLLYYAMPPPPATEPADSAMYRRVKEQLEQTVIPRARAADLLSKIGPITPQVLEQLGWQLRHRTMSPNWRIHSLDGAMALRTLMLVRAPNSLRLAREYLWLDDPALVPLNNPEYKVPPSWVDFRIKNVIFPALEKRPGVETEKLCRDYLVLSDEEAKKIGPPQFEPAAHTLLTISPKTETALELMHHRLQVVRGRAILDCLKHADESWARDALRQGAPHALAYIPPS